MQRETLVVDVDGVLCGLVDSAIPVINNLFNCDVSRGDIHMFEMDRVVGVKTDDFNEIFERLEYSKMQLIEGAADGLAKLSTRFHIVVATSRPVNLFERTGEWLRRNRLAFHAFMSIQQGGPTVSKKSDLYPLANSVIDDDLREAIAASECAKVVCLLDAPWNHSINAQRRFIRCRDWQEIVDTCMSMER